MVVKIYWQRTFCCISLQIPWRSRSACTPFKFTLFINLNKWTLFIVWINIASTPWIRKTKQKQKQKQQNPKQNKTKTKTRNKIKKIFTPVWNPMVTSLWYYMKRLVHIYYLKQPFLLIWTNENLPPWEVMLLRTPVLVKFSVAYSGRPWRKYFGEHLWGCIFWLS